MLLTLFALAIALGGTFIAVLFGDRTTRLLALLPAALLVMVYVPAVAIRPTLQLGFAFCAAVAALALFLRTKRRRDRLRARHAPRP